MISLIYRIKKNKQNQHTKQTNEKTKSNKKKVCRYREHRVVVARREEGAEGEMLKGDPLHDDEWKLNLR